VNDLTLEDRLQAAESTPTARAEKLDILEYWRAISKRRWSILALAFLVAVLAALVVFSLRPTYRSTATLLIEPGKTKVLSVEQVYDRGFVDRDHYYTQVEILKSDELARRTVEKLNLAAHPDFDPRMAGPGWRARLLPASWLPEEKPLTDDQIVKRVVAKFKDDLQVQLVRNSQLVQISFTSYDKELAAKVPNTLAEIYIESDLEARMAMTQKATTWMRDRMGDLRTKLEASEKALQDYRERERIVDAKGVSMSGAGKQLEELSRSLVEARQKRAEAESAYQQVQQARSGKGTSMDTLPAVLRHPLVQKLKEQEGEAERKFTDASKRYGPEHPKLIQAKAEFDSAKENTRRQMEMVVAGVAKEYEMARANEGAVERALGQSKFDIQSLNRKEFQLAVLEREVQQNRNLYEMFVGRLKETSVGSDLQTTVARLIDPATASVLPYAPKKAQIVVISFAVALVLAAMLALLLDRLNNTLNSTSDVEHRLGLPVLGVLHKVKGFSKRGFASQLAFFNDTQSTFAEAVRTVRTGVMMSALDHQRKVVVVTSSVPEEGKTTLSFNLAGALGQVKKVLLIDADLRRPKIGKLVGRDSKAPGLADVVVGQAQLTDAVFFHAAAGIHILPAGTVPPNPLELLASKRFEEILEKLKSTFDVVLIDSAPLQLVSDALVLSQHASSVIYVVRADATPYPVAQNGLRRLRRVGAPVLGIVLNQLDLERAEKYYGEYSGYYSYKGYKKYGYGHSKVYGQAD
jgi:succinoglycan biosynthesis transport protein ExoP